jgi:hypothetical protein
MGAGFAASVPEEKLTAGRWNVFGKRLWISASVLEGREVLLAVEWTDSEVGSLG